MNKKTSMLIGLLFLAAIPVMAQPPGGGRFQMRTVAERVQRAHNFLDSSFNKEIAAPKMAMVDSAFASYYRATDKLREDMMAAAGGQRPDQGAMDEFRSKVQELGVERDEKLQKVFTEAQYKKWKDELEAAMMPRRGPGGGGNRGGGGR